MLFRGGLRGLTGLAGRSLGLALRYRAQKRWLSVIGGATTRRLLDVYPRIAYRPSTTYLFEGATWGQRQALLESHYGFLNRAYDPAFFDAVIGPGGLTLWQNGSAPGDPAIALVGPCMVSRHREGELGLNFTFNGNVLYKLAFSVVPVAAVADPKGRAADGSGLALFIGQVQGSPCCLDQLREASKLCLGIAPRDLLMSALAGVAQAWDVDTIFGARADRVLSSESCSFDYNAFWDQYGGKPTVTGHYAMPLPFHEGPIQASSSAHRRRTRRKRQFQAELADVVKDILIWEHKETEGASESSGSTDLDAALRAMLCPPAEDSKVAA